MKQKVSISMDEKTIKKIENKIVNSIFRSKSHLVEYATLEFLKEK